MHESKTAWEEILNNTSTTSSVGTLVTLLLPPSARIESVWMSRKVLSSLTSRIEFAFRPFLSRSPSPFRCKHSDTTADDKDKDKDNQNKSSEESSYDPKKDDFFTQDKAFGSKDNKGSGNSERPVFNPDESSQDDQAKSPLVTEEELEAPTNCCLSGCANCVWIDYVDKLSKKFSDPTLGRARILKELDAIDDEMIKAYIMMELRVKKLI